MSVFQLLSCDVALGGDILNVVARHQFNPVTYPEMLILKFIHGQDAVTNIVDVGATERDDADEGKRLSETYGDELVRGKLFPGAGTRLPNGDNKYKPALALPVAPVPAEPVPEVILPAGSVDFNAPQEPTPSDTYAPSAAPVPAPEAPRSPRKPVPVYSPDGPAAT